MAARFNIDKTSDAAGEISPLLIGRPDLEPYQTGLRSSLNMITVAEGAAQRRAGTQFVTYPVNENRPVRLIPFEASITDNYMTVWNGGKMRLCRDNGVVTVPATGLPYEITHPFQDAWLEGMQTQQIQDQLFMAIPGVAPHRLTRISDVDWQLVAYPYTAGPVRLMNSDPNIRLQASAATGTITITASQPVFQANHVDSVWRIEEGDLTSPGPWRAATTYALGAKVRYKARIYEATNAADSGSNPPVHDNGDASAGQGAVTWRYIGNSYGYFRITAFTNSTTVTASVVQRLPDRCVAAQTSRWYEAAWSSVRGWPTSVGLLDGSLVWGRNNEIWITQSLDLYSFEFGDEDDNGLSLALQSPDGKRVETKWIMGQGVLVVGARANEWIVRGPGTFDRLAAATMKAIPQGSEGSASQQPVMLNGGAVYIGRSRERLHYARFDPLQERLEFRDFTDFAAHMLKGEAVQLAYQHDRHRILWIRQADGTCSAVTFKPDQNVLGWHRHTFGDRVESIGCIQSADEKHTDLWLCVDRTVNGATRRMIEVARRPFRALDADEPTAAGAWLLDCALRYAGAPITTLTGLDHLEGEEVHIIADGRTMPPQIVTGGQITLPRAASDVIAGLSVPWKLRFLPIDVQLQIGTSRGSTKNTSHVTLLLHESAGGKVRVNKGEPESIAFTGGQAMGQPLPLLTGTARLTVNGPSDRQLDIEISGDGPLPFTCLAMTAHVIIGDS